MGVGVAVGTDIAAGILVAGRDTGGAPVTGKARTTPGVAGVREAEIAFVGEDVVPGTKIVDPTTN